MLEPYEFEHAGYRINPLAGSRRTGFARDRVIPASTGRAFKVIVDGNVVKYHPDYDKALKSAMMHARRKI